MLQPYAEADAKETASRKAEEDAKAAAKSNGAGKAADAKADGKADAKKVRLCSWRRKHGYGLQMLDFGYCIRPQRW